ncbi:hypothetical protein NG830_19170 [Pantoea ananatis]|uniref:Bbp19 family protein n=1 Tax=Pantoea ananas TaxID=553 RepID=UPI0021E784FF|nr:hypothetical protein [Pantoea ananatis]MCW0310530.1 hypothetical protein [Pantoea ananatis]UYL01304.1 hypothetical protein NG830_19170 [Pantoea ananatis]
MTKPTDFDYVTLFESCPAGPEILEQLVSIFGNNPYVKGGHDADRQTAFNAGQLHVVNYILNRINRGNNPQMTQERDDD